MPLNWRNILIAIAFAIILVPSYTLVGISIYKKLSSGNCKDTKNFSNDTDSPENEEKDKGGDDKGDQEENDEEESRKRVPEPVKSTTTVMLTTTVKPRTTTEALIDDSDNPGGKCYRDRNSRDLPKKFIIPNGQISSIYWCTSKCRKEDYKYAGVQNTNECYCGDSYGKHGLKYDCYHTCNDHHKELCGDWYRSNIYKSELPEGRCYNDDLNDRDMIFINFIPLYQLSNIEWCKKECRRKLYYFAGVRNANVCSCGNKFGKHNLSSRPSKCNLMCQDQTGVNLCGGTLSNNIYSSDLEERLSDPEGMCYSGYGLTRQNKAIWINSLPNSAITYCKNHCSAYAFASLMRGYYCVCGNSFDVKKRVDENNCVSVCRDSMRHKKGCGGNIQNTDYSNVYKVYG